MPINIVKINVKHLITSSRDAPEIWQGSSSQVQVNQRVPFITLAMSFAKRVWALPVSEGACDQLTRKKKQRQTTPEREREKDALDGW